MSNPRLKTGDLAPDITIQDKQGNTIQIAAAWKNGPTLLVFLRHFG